jgi:3-oxoadipate enol-lactonase
MRGLCLLMILIVSAACGAFRPAPGRVESGEAPVENGTLHYEVSGEGAAVVLVHGGFGDRRMWDGQFRELARDFRVVRYDHRGFGLSPAPRGPYSPVADLVRLLDQLGMERAHLVGNSMGGTLALDAALVHPERVGKVVVIASGANGYPYTEAEAESVVRVFRAARAEGVERAAEMWLDHAMVAVASRDPRTAPLLRRMVHDNRNVFLMEHWPSERLASPAFQRLGEIRVPVLFLLGDRDTPNVRRVAEASAQGIPGARLEVVAGTDHLPQMERPEEVNRLVREFLLTPGGG